MNKGLFLTIEGPDGSGKTTVSDILCKKLEKMKIGVVHTREPGGIDIAEQIRSVILNPNNTKMDARTEALLYAASRRQHLVEKVIPALNKKKLVLCERFLDSSLAYQGVARKIGVKEVYSINKFAIDEFMPDLTIYLDIDEKKGLKRIESRASKDRLDKESVKFHHEVVKGYKQVIKKYKNRIRIVNADQELEKVVDDCMKIICKYLYDKRFIKK